MKITRAITILTLFSFIILLFNGPSAVGQVIYVDNQLSTDCSGNYSIGNRNCSGSDGDAYQTLAGAAGAATAGTTVSIRAGVFTSQLSPQNSGTEGNYITFKNYQNEVVEITGESLSPAIWIEKKDYIAIEGLQVREVRRWLNALGSNYLIVKNNVFERALDSGGSSKTGVFLQQCHYAKILNNELHDTTQDNLYVQESDYNLVEGNNFTKGFHVLWTFKCSNYNIIRNNYMHNELQKIGEIYDCENTGFGSEEFPKMNSYDDSKYNIVENNVFAFTPSSGDSSPYSGIQYAGQYGIIRNNLFYDMTGPGLSLSIYGGEASYCYENRIYNNVFHDNRLGAIGAPEEVTAAPGAIPPDVIFSNQKIVNNIFYENEFALNDTRWEWYEELKDNVVHIITGRESDILFDNNNFFPSAEEDLYAFVFGVRSSTFNRAPKPLSWWEDNKNSLIKNSLQENPDFYNPTARDFHLYEGSPMIDAGAFLATTTISGTSNTIMDVDDAGWFTDGFGVVPGDTIQLEGQSDWAIISSVDYANNILTLDRPLTWEAQQGVSLPYSGPKPDLGAFEYDANYVAEKLVTAIKNDIQNNGLTLYPNPIRSYATLTFENFSGEPYDISIFDMNGREVQTIDSISQKSLRIERANLLKGVYVFKVIEGNRGIWTGKFMVE